MSNTTDSVKFSETERAILEAALQNPDLTNAEIAEEVGARIALVRDTRNEYEDEVELAEGVGDDAAGTAAADEADLSDTQAAIVEAAEEDPGLSNAEIAEEVGARIALVRDTRAEYGVEFDPTAAESDDAVQPSESDDDAEPSDLQTEIVAFAENNPEATNAEIADEVGARITLVRDTLSEFGGDGSAAADTGSSDDGSEASAEIDTDEFSDLQVEILEAAAANPEATNAEIAEEVGARITLVRDTIYEHESDDTESADDAGESDDGTDVLEDVDTAAFSETQLDILEVALANPELTNGEIAEQTGTRITLVRDTIHEHEYDEKPWVGNVEDDDGDDEDEHEATTVSDTDDEIEMPETTDSELLSDVEQAILEAALENADLTNAEIAEHVGARLTLVRDTRATYEEAVDLPAEDDGSDDAVTAGSTGPGEPTATQEAILEAAGADPEATNAEIAEQTGTRIPLVRDTLATYDTADADTGDTADSAEADTADAGDSADAGSGGISAGPIVAILVALALAIAVAASLGVI